jgi:hypothetical protein
MHNPNGGEIMEFLGAIAMYLLICVFLFIAYSWIYTLIFFIASNAIAVLGKFIKNH